MSTCRATSPNRLSWSATLKTEPRATSVVNNAVVTDNVNLLLAITADDRQAP